VAEPEQLPLPGFEEPFAVAEAPKAAVADRGAAQVVCSRDLPAELFTAAPLGRRILVVRELPEDKVGSIIVPDTVQDKHPKSAGWVISAGPFVGEFEGSFAQLCHYRAEEILLRKFLFGRWAGIGVPVVDKDGRPRGGTDWGPEFILMMDSDLLMELEEKR